MTYSSQEKIKWLAIFSRILVLSLQYLANSALPDHEAGVFTKPLSPERNDTYLDVVVAHLLNGLTRWDGQYFLHVAEYGYTYENTLAFFPLFPYLIRFFSVIFMFVFENVPFCSCIISMHNLLVLVAVIFNNVLFVGTALVFLHLSRVVLKNDRLAYVSAVLFCFNPASIFFSAVYSESLYCFITFYALWKLELRNSFANNLIVGLACVTRSNGLLNIGFIFYHYLKLRINFNFSFLFHYVWCIGTFVTLLPFVMFQAYSYSKYCLSNPGVVPEFIERFAHDNSFVLPGGVSMWCKNSIPLPYSAIQSQYWNVGLFKYYEFKQIPNFLLALPVMFILWKGAFRFVGHYKGSLVYLGTVVKKPTIEGELPINAFVYIAHALVLTLVGLFMIHVQVSTRLIASSSPAFYWFCAQAMSDCLPKPVAPQLLRKLNFSMVPGGGVETTNNLNSLSRTFFFTATLTGYARFIKLYFILFFLVGTVLFSNYFPWT